MSSPSRIMPQKSPQGKQRAGQNAPNTGKPPPRRQRGRRHQQQEATATDSAVVSSEDVQAPLGQRSAKKHTLSQPSSERVFSPTNVASNSLTDTETAPKDIIATPAKAQTAYAGPTFHASPAASALPIPKFLSKSVPAKTANAPPTPPEEGADSPPSPTPSPPSPSRAPIPVPAPSEFNINTLFQAHREESARKASASPASVEIMSSPSGGGNARPAHVKQYSQSSLHNVFPIELDAETRPGMASPPVAVPDANRPITAPSNLPQTQHTGYNDNAAINALFDRLQSSKQRPAVTPPRVADRVPSEPSSRHQSPSPFYNGGSVFRSASGPTTPAPVPQESSDYIYPTRRNLMNSLQAVKSDSPRNSRLRTEVTADSPLMHQGGFPAVNGGFHGPMNGTINGDSSSMARNYMGNMNDSPNRRGSVPHIPPYREPPISPKPRTPNRRSFHPRPDSYPNRDSNMAPAAKQPPPMPKATTMSFIPSSVAARRHSNTPSAANSTKPSPPPSAPPFLPPSSSQDIADPQSLEQNLKRMLNVNVDAPVNGVR
ncbi:hypothetical protein EJ04DRAFT_131252 [Polyplosphaeria fusca]|uniref:Uncharacterized protein n=1 Tax=Polyplosphaeria fusca TaxID=682080 RepID=A0A9P4QJZ4_9PLEO|nr:hypothetical protein EJ04DRAFT_131252 [Polyplosphaeria fusca]